MNKPPQIDSKALEVISKSREMKRAVKALADEIADNVRSLGIRVQGVPGDIELPVKVFEDTTDRARCSVQIAHPSGKAVQAKHGALTKAAAQAGVRVSD